VQGKPAGWREARRNWQRARRAERQFAQQLRAVARQIGQFVKMWKGPGTSTAGVEEILRRYSDLIGPWAQASSERLIAEVSRRDARSWQELGKRVNRALRQEIETAPTGPALRELMAAQTGLIKDMPLEAEQRIRELAMSAVSGGRRWEEVAKDILDQEGVSRARANVIARTETGRASSVVTEARAVHIGSPGYFWRTSLDADVRPQHKRLEGSFHRWDSPPIASEPSQREMRYHPGAGPNCRCYAEPVMADQPISEGRRPRNPEYLAALRAAGYTTGAAFE
jgi:SPP1 gp7 family putative phage head morphogenesis protein